MAADTIDRLLTSLTVRANAFAVCEIQSGHRLAFDPSDAVTIHYVLAGRGTIVSPGNAEASYGPCCVVLVPARIPHSLGEPEAALRSPISTAARGLIANGLVRFTAGDGTRDTLVVCATVTAIYGGALGLCEGMTAPIVQDSTAGEGLVRAFADLDAEIAAPGIGVRAMVEALMKQVLILVLRHHLLRLDTRSPLFGALHDSRLVKAVTAVIEQPARDWTVDGLASLCAMSRSTFAERFAGSFGQSPMEFVQAVRLRLGADLLRTTDLPVPVIAASAGYRSRTYFSRTFKSAHGIGPCAYRQRTRREEVWHAVPSDARPRRSGRGVATSRAAVPDDLRRGTPDREGE